MAEIENCSNPTASQGVIETIRSRRTINFFKPLPVPEQVLLEAIESACWAPNHKKTEPWRFLLLGESTREKLRALITDLKATGQDDSVRKAVRDRLDAIPGWLVLCCRISEDPITQAEDQAACACAAQNMMLHLWQAGIGVKWTTGKVIRDPRCYEILGTDMHAYAITGLFWYGYPEHIPEQTRKSLSEVINILD